MAERQLGTVECMFRICLFIFEIKVLIWFPFLLDFSPCRFIDLETSGSQYESSFYCHGYRAVWNACQHNWHVNKIILKEFCFPSMTSCTHGQQLTSRPTPWNLSRGNYQGSWRATGLPGQAATTRQDSDPQRQVRTTPTHALYIYSISQAGWLTGLIIVVSKCWDFWLKMWNSSTCIHW